MPTAGQSWLTAVVQEHQNDGCTQEGKLELFSHVSKDMIDREVADDALADLPAADVFSDGNNFSRQI